MSARTVQFITCCIASSDCMDCYIGLTSENSVPHMQQTPYRLTSNSMTTDLNRSYRCLDRAPYTFMEFWLSVTICASSCYEFWEIGHMTSDYLHLIHAHSARIPPDGLAPPFTESSKWRKETSKCQQTKTCTPW